MRNGYQGLKRRVKEWSAVDDSLTEIKSGWIPVIGPHMVGFNRAAKETVGKSLDGLATMIGTAIDQPTKSKDAVIATGQEFKENPWGSTKAVLSGLTEDIRDDWKAGRYGEVGGDVTGLVVEAVVGGKGTSRLRLLRPKPVPKAPTLFGEFGVTPGAGLNLTTPSAGTRSFITYGLRDSKGSVSYVGRASGTGSPQEVMASRFAKGHHVAEQHPELEPFVIDVQSTLGASRGAEEFFIQGYREEGASLLNVDPAVGFSTTPRGQKSVGYLDEFFADLEARR